jgi:hypothetical protein
MNHNLVKWPNILPGYNLYTPIPVAAKSKAWVYGRSLAGIVSSNPTGSIDICLL